MQKVDVRAEKVVIPTYETEPYYNLGFALETVNIDPLDFGARYELEFSAETYVKCVDKRRRC